MEILLCVNILLFAFKLIEGLKDNISKVEQNKSNGQQDLRINQPNKNLKYSKSLQSYYEFDDIQENNTFLEKIENIIHESTIYNYVDNIKFKYWTPLSFIDIKFNHESILKEYWIKGKPLKIITHGWNSKKDEDKRGVFVMINAYVSSKLYNVITMDWTSIANTLNYVKAARKCTKIGTVLGYFLINLIKLEFVRPSDIHIIGHSIGAHLAGKCGRMFFSLTGKKFSRITGLDPSSPRFQDSITTYKPNIGLQKSDAQFVDVIHSAKGFLGISIPIGHADFYPNNGQSPQPGCESTKFIRALKCSHSRSYKFYMESITEEKSFESLKCPSMKEFNQGKCNNNERNFMGHNANPIKHGTFFLKTNDGSPFSKNFKFEENP